MIEIVTISPEFDGRMGLYIDRELVLEGDEYHDRISSRIEGFLEGLTHAGWEFDSIHWYLSEEHPAAHGIACGGLPVNFGDFPKELTTDCP